MVTARSGAEQAEFRQMLEVSVRGHYGREAKREAWRKEKETSVQVEGGGGGGV